MPTATAAPPAQRSVTAAAQARDVTRCPLDHRQTRRLFEKDSCWIRVCLTCGHQFAELLCPPDHVARVYADEYFHGGGAGYSDYFSEATLLRAHGRRYAHQLARYMPPGSVLDVGSAAGFTLKGFEDAGWKGTGIEPNPTMADYARSQLDLAVQGVTLEEMPLERQFDLVAMIQVLPHFVAPADALERAAALTLPFGFWLIETWDRASWTARAFGRRWHEYSPPSVLHWFSADGLRDFVGRFGFHEITRGRPSKWLNGGHARALLKHHLGATPFARLALPALRLIPNSLAIPYPAEDVFWVLFQRLR